MQAAFVSQTALVSEALVVSFSGGTEKQSVVLWMVLNQSRKMYTSGFIGPVAYSQYTYLHIGISADDVIPI